MSTVKAMHYFTLFPLFLKNESEIVTDISVELSAKTSIDFHFRFTILQDESEIDTDILFGNLPGIVELSAKILQQLNNIDLDDPKHDNIMNSIGECCFQCWIISF